MPPPGAVPPGYSYNHIPQSFMNKRPAPEGADSNTRAYLIFFSYLGLCVTLTLFVIQKLLSSYLVLTRSTTTRPPPRKHVVLFVGLAAGSVLTTWYYMVQYFKVSYQIWLMWRSYYELSYNKTHWGLWLKETSLFKEAWEISIVGNARYWWTHQIFFFASALGLVLEQKGLRRGIRHTWVFMLIGQTVSIGFATNLFFLALLLSPPVVPAPLTDASRKSKWLGPWLINLIATVATLLSANALSNEEYWHGKDGKPFMPVVMIPHIALMALPIARAILPAKYSTDDDVGFAEKVYKYLWSLTIFGGGLVWLRVTGTAYRYAGISGIMNALLEHPAVSTVGFDVVFCWVSWMAWWRLQRQGLDDMDELEDEKNDTWEGAGSGTTVHMAGDNTGGELRRR